MARPKFNINGITIRSGELLTAPVIIITPLPPNNRAIKNGAVAKTTVTKDATNSATPEIAAVILKGVIFGDSYFSMF